MWMLLIRTVVVGREASGNNGGLQPQRLAVGCKSLVRPISFFLNVLLSFYKLPLSLQTGPGPELHGL